MTPPNSREPVKVVQEALERAIADCGGCWGDHEGTCSRCAYLREALAATTRLSSTPAVTSGSAREIVEALFTDLRDRKFLEYLFDAEPNSRAAYGYIDSPLHLSAQDEIRSSWIRIIESALGSHCGEDK